MKKMVKILQLRKWGFTLVEALVVAVIMGILAAVAITLYTGYINDQRQSTVNTLAETAAASANAFLRRTGNDPTLEQLNLHYDANSYTIAVTPANNTISVTDRNHTSFTKTVSY